MTDDKNKLELKPKLKLPRAPYEPMPSELQRAFAGCTRFLHGHGPAKPAKILAELAEEAAEEGADIYGRGAIIQDFEAELAGLLGKPSALFLPSGTMAQQILLRIVCDRRGLHSVGFHPTCHLELHCAGTLGRVHGIHSQLIGGRERLISLADLEGLEVPIAALLLELPQREIGGPLPGWSELSAQSAWAKERGIWMHMDGARLWESQPFYGRPHADICALFDSVYVSFYKGLGGVAGAMLLADPETIAEARVWQRRLGGTLTHLYPYILSARRGLRERLAKLAQWRDRAQAVARVLSAIPGVRVTPDPPQTLMMHVFLEGSPERLMAASASIAAEAKVRLVHRLRATAVPGIQYFELMVGEAAETIPTEELGELFGKLMERASA